MSTKRALLRASLLLQQDSVGGKTAKADVRLFYDRKSEKASDGAAASPDNQLKANDFSI